MYTVWASFLIPSKTSKGKQMETREIFVTVKSVYGNEMIYPACPVSKIFAELTETKTLSRYAIGKIKALGYTVTVSQPVTSL